MGVTVLLYAAAFGHSYCSRAVPAAVSWAGGVYMSVTLRADSAANDSRIGDTVLDLRGGAGRAMAPGGFAD
jgi:hypothetical protein